VLYTFPITDKRTLQIPDPWDNSGRGDYNINQTEIINRFLTTIDKFHKRQFLQAQMLSKYV